MSRRLVVSKANLLHRLNHGQQSSPYGAVGRLHGLLLCVLCSLPVWAFVAPTGSAFGGNAATGEAAEENLIETIEKVRPAFVFVGGGSGVLISPDGYILTNYHVVGKEIGGAGAKEWMVYLSSLAAHTDNGTSYRAKLVGEDPRGDIALLKIPETDKPFPYVEIGDSDTLSPGQSVIVIGNPFRLGELDLQPSVSTGIISALHRYKEDYSDAIQIDAPVNPGNSGGPLITLDGKLVGINGRIDTRHEFIKINTGIGYAIPVNQIKKFLDILKKGGKVRHSFIEGLALSKENTDGAGVRVENVSPGSSGDKAGLQKGDTILKVDNLEVYNYNRFNGIIGTYPAGSSVILTVKQVYSERSESAESKGGITQVPITLNARGGIEELAKPDEPFLGVRFTADTPASRRVVEIEEVIPDTPAAKADLRPDDIIVSFNGKTVTAVNQLRNLIKNSKIGDKVTLTVKRADKELEITVVIEGRQK